jgi:hypothetical protein
MLLIGFCCGMVSRVFAAEIVVGLYLNRAFPQHLTVNAGDTVRWTAEGSQNEQYVESYTGEFSSPILGAPGDSFSFTFNKAGTVAYRHRPLPFPERMGRTEYGGIIRVLPITNSAPPILINTPLDGSFFGYSRVWNRTYPISFLATPSRQSAELARVEYFAGTNLIGVVTNAPYQFVWDNAPVGTHFVTGRAVEQSGLTTVSPPIRIVVEEIESPILRNPRILPGGVFAADYTLSPVTGARYSAFREFDLRAGTDEERQALREGFGTIFDSVGTNRMAFFYIGQRF